MEYELLHEHNGGMKLVGFTDADWAGCVEDKKSTLGCCFNIGSGIISRFNKKNISMALRSIEVEYMATGLLACEALWLRMLLLGLFRQELEATMIHCDNHSCIKLSENPMFHDHSKHIDINYHFIRDCV